VDRWLEILVPVCCVGGIVAMASDSQEAIQLLRGAGTTTLVGASLLLLGATAGLMNYVMMRKQSRGLAMQASEAIASGKRTYIDAPENSLGPLVIALNDGFSAAERSVTDAMAQVKELEIQLKVATTQRQQAQAIINSINDAVLVTDRFDEVLLANDATGKTLGIEPKLAHRKPLDQVITDGSLITLIRDVRQSKTAHERRVVEHKVRRNGKDAIYKLTLSAINGDGTAPGGVVAVFHDMTRETEIARMKNDFVSSVSHELRTPLASIRAYIEMLIDGEAQDEKTQREFHDIIQNEANRLGRLIDNILNISRIESGLVEIKRAPISPSLVVKQALEVIVPQAKLKSIRLDEQLDPSFYQTLADKDMLYQAVLNLLSNAVKYTPEGGSVGVRTLVDESQKRVCIKISDTGVGIPAKDLPFLFDKFFRVEANKNVAKGTGLGLSLVKNIIEVAHKGKVSVESERGKGSCFTIELDLC
jgi:two-component system, OmpR family, phosphate regulon sensor histidine kinase PhoR